MNSTVRPRFQVRFTFFRTCRSREQYTDALFTQKSQQSQLKKKKKKKKKREKRRRKTPFYPDPNAT